MSRKLVSFFAAVAVVAASFGSASADPLSRNVSVAVTYADLDLSKVEGVQALSMRINKAIDQACGRMHDTASLSIRNKIKACRTAAKDRAVAQIDAPLLTALHTGSAGQRIAGL